MDGDAKLPFGSMEMEILKKLPAGDKAMKMMAPLLATQKDPIKMFVPFYVEFK